MTPYSSIVAIAPALAPFGSESAIGEMTAEFLKGIAKTCAETEITAIIPWPGEDFDAPSHGVAQRLDKIEVVHHGKRVKFLLFEGTIDKIHVLILGPPSDADGWQVDKQGDLRLEHAMIFAKACIALLTHRRISPTTIHLHGPSGGFLALLRREQDEGGSEVDEAIRRAKLAMTHYRPKASATNVDAASADDTLPSDDPPENEARSFSSPAVQMLRESGFATIEDAVLSLGDFVFTFEPPDHCEHHSPSATVSQIGSSPSPLSRKGAKTYLVHPGVNRSEWSPAESLSRAEHPAAWQLSEKTRWKENYFQDKSIETSSDNLMAVLFVTGEADDKFSWVTEAFPAQSPFTLVIGRSGMSAAELRPDQPAIPVFERRTDSKNEIQQALAAADLVIFAEGIFPDPALALKAMGFAALPIVYAQNGERPPNLLINFDEHSGTGTCLSLSDPSTEGLTRVLNRVQAMQTLAGGSHWRQLRQNLLRQNSPWTTLAKQYLDVFSNGADTPFLQQ